MISGINYKLHLMVTLKMLTSLLKVRISQHSSYTIRNLSTLCKYNQHPILPQKHIYSLHQTRGYFWEFIRWTDRIRYPTAEVFFIRDRINQSLYQLVYKNEMSTRSTVILATCIGLVLLCGNAFVVLSLITDDVSERDPYDEIGQDWYTILLAGIFNFQALLAYLALSRVVLRVYFSPFLKHFVGIKINPWFPVRSKQFIIEPASVVRKQIPYDIGIFTELFGNHLISGKRAQLYPNHFKIPAYYNVLIGSLNVQDVIPDDMDPKSEITRTATNYLSKRNH